MSSKIIITDEQIESVFKEYLENEDGLAAFEIEHSEGAYKNGAKMLRDYLIDKFPDKFSK